MSLEKSRTDQSSNAFDDWHLPVRRSYWGPSIFGLTVLVFLIGSFGLWASTAELASATVAQGVFVATGTNKTVQHLEGGIIDEILVEEGQEVQAGQPLVRFDAERVGAELRRHELQHRTLQATISRLSAEQDIQDEIKFPPELLDTQGDPEFQGIIEAQRNLFAARSTKHRDEINIQVSRVSAIEEEIGGLEAQKEAAEEQLKLLQKELAMNEGLMEKGLARLPTVLQLRRAAVKLKGDVGQFTSSIGQARQRILEIKGEILSIRSRHAQELADDFGEARTKLDDAAERLRAARDIERRLTVRAPVPGVVIKLHHHTTGGVVGPGEKIMDLLPSQEKLLVEAYVRPQDIDQVRRGLAADLRLSALDQRTTPVVFGEVIYVSADTIEGKQPGEQYYVARIAISEDQLARLEGVEIAPGMPAEVYIKTGARTLVQYIVRPLTNSFSRAFRER
ncbi:MAG: HlyD family type I secretion periplasmic adaptor subunit [Alphaproteobacteria bacterium]|nr:HlyD family type I secretion periplasmic adaptor subunit [Alphaproteobacteria bacterium]